MAPSRKTHAAYAANFLQAYSRDRKFHKIDLMTPEYGEVVRWSNAARESYKLANATEEPPADATDVVRRHLRRLANNRRSAAAARVYHEALRVDCAHALYGIMHRAAVAQSRVAEQERECTLPPDWS